MTGRLRAALSVFEEEDCGNAPRAEHLITANHRGSVLLNALQRRVMASEIVCVYQRQHSYSVPEIVDLSSAIAGSRPYAPHAKSSHGDLRWKMRTAG